MQNIRLARQACEEIDSMRKFFGCGPKVEKIYEIAHGVVLVLASDNTYRYYLHSSVVKFKIDKTAKFWGVRNSVKGKVFTFFLKMHNASWSKVFSEAESRIFSRDGKKINWFLKPKQIA